MSIRKRAARRPIGRHGVSPKEARQALASYYSETPEAEKTAFRRAWMAEVDLEITRRVLSTPRPEGEG